MFWMIDKIQIQYTHYNVDELMTLCNEKIIKSKVQPWEKEIYLFIQDWFSPADSIIVSTSGSTGSPKKIQLQKKYMVASAKTTLSFFNLSKNDAIWLCLPAKYIAGKMMIVRSIVGNLNLLYSEPNSLPSIQEGQKVAFAAMVPNQVFGLLNTMAGLQQLSKIENLLIGGAPISDKLEDMLLAIPDIVAWHSYGMTETITHIALRKISGDNRAIRYHTLKGINVRTNSNRQLLVDAPIIGVEELVTNDIVDLFDDGSFNVVGRADNVIVSGGVKLFPEVIEKKIRHLISHSFFIGSIPDEKLGELLILLIEGEVDDSYHADMLMNKFKKYLSKFEVPKEIVYLSEFTRTETGKIMRQETIHCFLNEQE